MLKAMKRSKVCRLCRVSRFPVFNIIRSESRRSGQPTSHIYIHCMHSQGLEYMQGV